MTVFLIVAGAMAAVAAVLIVRPLLAGGGDAPDANRDAADAQLYRDQLKELERDVARGVITPGEAQGARAEISRRLIRSARAAKEAEGALGRAPRQATGMLAGIALLAAPAIGAGIYLAVGSPGQPDRPLAERLAERPVRPSQAEAEERFRAEAGPVVPAGGEDYAAMVAQLEEVLARRPDDAEGLRLLGTALMRQERYGEAWPVLERLIALVGAEAGADLHAAKAESMVLAAGGYVSPEAELAIRRALETDPSNAMARYYAGLTLAQEGREAEAAVLWQGLVDTAPPDAPWRDFVAGMLAELRRSLAGGVPGPSPEEVAAAEGMTPEARQAMIEGMVASLDARLAAENGTAEEWFRLISSYARLGRMEEAGKAYDRAIEAIGSDADRQALRMAVRSVGLGPDGAVVPGPSQSDIEAAAAMTPEERRQMVEGMVARLEERIVSAGGEPEDWVRLISAYVTLGRPEEARRIYDLSQERLEGSTAGFVREQALVMGVAE